ncbi:Multicopper oxidase [uncultured virus]|nr:Multicopper oxidase [uncultured virus]
MTDHRELNQTKFDHHSNTKLFPIRLKSKRCFNRIGSQRLVVPPLIDITEGKNIVVEFKSSQHKYSQDAAPSGIDFNKEPIFGCVTHIDGSKKIYTDFGLPFFKLKQGNFVEISFINKTGYTFNLHWHGVNVPADIDGANEQMFFGKGTRIGERLNIKFPVYDCSAMLWIHAHPMLFTSPFINSGILGLLNIIDDESAKVTDEFIYGDNHLMLYYQDLDFRSNGSQTLVNIYQGSRSCFGAINGTSCVNWYTFGDVQYVNKLYHKSHRKRVKIDFINATTNFRFVYLGIRDVNHKMRSFWVIQSSNGLINPRKFKMIGVAPAERISLLIDLKNYKQNEIELFFYNYDLTQITATKPFSTEPDNTEILGYVPNIELSSNPTPSPTPIPDPTGNSSYLDYPNVPEVSFHYELLRNGYRIPPQQLHKPYTIKPFLKINLHPNEIPCPPIDTIIYKIRDVVFGYNYKIYKSTIDKPYFEYTSPLNYLKILNPKYFHDLPDFTTPISRQIVLTTDFGKIYDYPSKTQLCRGKNKTSSEYIYDTEKLYVDFWNSEELDLDYAIGQYNLNPNNYQPDILPTCLFKIYPPNHEYHNYGMLENNKLTIQIFKDKISYGDKTTSPIATATIIFPTNYEPININKWRNIVIKAFNKTNINIDGTIMPISAILDYNWSFFPFKQSYITQRSLFLKSVVMKSTNKTDYYIRFVAKWGLLKFFGKYFGAMYINPTIDHHMVNVGGIDDPVNHHISNVGGVDDPTVNHHTVNISSSHRPDPIINHHMGNISSLHKSDPTIVGRTFNPTINHHNFEIQPSLIHSMIFDHNMSNVSDDENFDINDSTDRNHNHNVDHHDRNANIQQMFVEYATDDPNKPIMIMMNEDAELIINPNNTFLGIIDGFQSDTFLNFSVKMNSSEKWKYTNLSESAVHPLHFHLTSGYVSVDDPENSQALVSPLTSFCQFLYSQDTIAIPQQQTINFYLKFINYNSSQSFIRPKTPYLGYMIHCHYIIHHDMNMMGSYYVYSDKKGLLEF